MAITFRSGARALAAVFTLAFANAFAQTPLLNEVHTVAAADQGVPVEHSFDVTAPGTYSVTLVDLGAILAPAAPLNSVQLAVTSGTNVVATLTAAGTTQFDATAGTYVVHVIGAPGSQLGSGPFGVQIIDKTDGNSLFQSFSDTLALAPAALPSDESTLDDSFSVTTSGNYTFTLADLHLPVPLAAVTAIVTTTEGTIVTTPALTAAGSTTVSLQSGVTYRIFAAGQADPTAHAGLFSATVVPAGGGAPAYSRTIAVGGVSMIDSVSLTSGASYTLKLTDLAYPAALGPLGGTVVSAGVTVATVAGTDTSQPFTATADSYQVFAVAVPGTDSTSGNSTSGSYAVALTSSASGSRSLSVARAVPAAGGSVSAYSFDAAIASAGIYTLDLADFGIPVPLVPLGGAVVQGGAVLGTPLAATGSVDVSAAAGPVSLLIFTQATSSGGLFGVDLTPKGATDPLFQQTQGVGQLFTSRQITVTAAASLAVQVGDLKFPASFSSFAAIVTRGTAHLGSVFGSGAFAFDATPGTYFVNFVAQPGGTDEAGTYSLNVSPGPVITLSSDVQTVGSGGTVNLTWTSQNTTSCAATGGLTADNLPTSGSAKSPALTASATFTITCSGEGVSASKQVSVTVTPPASKGGGGALTSDWLLALFGVLLMQLARRRAH